MKSAKSIIGKTVKIKESNDNENYNKFRNKKLIVTYASRSGIAYDECMYPELLCDFEDQQGNQIPFALYEYEFDILN